MRIYLDSCALNRLSDEQVQSRVREESSAVEAIFRHIYVQRVERVSSVALELEIGRNPNREKRSHALALLAYAPKAAEPPSEVEDRAESLRLLGYGTYDALHIACAEWERADYLITTDDRLIRLAKRRLGDPRIRVLNPVDWVAEVKHGAS